MKRLTWLLAFLLMALMIAPASARPFIVKEGQANAVIIIGENPTRSMRLAAWELQTYVEKMSGAKLPIVSTARNGAAVKIYIGAGAHTKPLGVTADGLKYGAYRIVSGDDWLVFIGDDSDFVPVEPYTRRRSDGRSKKFLDAWEAVAKGPWVPVNRSSFKNLFRNFDRFRGREVGDKPMDYWASDERGSYNGVCDFLRGLGVRWFMPGELGEVIPKRPSIKLPKVDRTVHPDFQIRTSNLRFGIHDDQAVMWSMRLGIRPAAGIGWAHGLNGVTRTKEMREKHPECYALYAGRRHQEKQCLSSPELLKQTVARARMMFDHFNAKVVSVQPADGYTSLCQCHLCKGKDQPEREYRGRMANYVWGFTIRVANEIAKTHPDRMISQMAYNLYYYPPDNVDKLPDNVVVCLIGGRRPTMVDPERRKEMRERLRMWEAKTNNPILNFENYPLTARGFWLPAFTPRIHAKSLDEVRGKFMGENIQPSAHRFMQAAAFNSFQFYFTYRLYWGGKGQDIEAFLDEYCRLFYGPAADEMRAFFDYCEAHYPDMRKEKAKADKALALFASAREKAAEGSIYDKRLAVMADYLEALKLRSVQIAKEQKRENTPNHRMWRGAQKVKIDGKLDDPFWASCPTWSAGTLRDLQTGRQPVAGTSFKVAWGANEIIFAVRCETLKGETPLSATDRNEDAAIWMGDCVEFLIETEQNSYYQIAINPKGAMADLNRAGGKKTFRWDSQAEVATTINEKGWNIEVRFPVIADTNDPFHQILGRRPLKNLPWYFNVCRQDVQKNGTAHSAFSPTGEKGFHVPSRFAKLYYK